MVLTQQQREQTGKRKSEQDENEGPENKKWAGEKPDAATKADSEDGWEVVVTQVTVSTSNQV